MENFNWNICLLILAVLLYDVTNKQKEVRKWTEIDQGKSRRICTTHKSPCQYTVILILVGSGRVVRNSLGSNARRVMRTSSKLPANVW